MNAQTELFYETFLSQHTQEAWSKTMTELLPSILEVDRNATQIWFYFFPLSLFEALEQSEDPQRLAKTLLLQGKYLLKDQIDSSHKFLYGHRFWPQVKRAVTERAESATPSKNLSLTQEIRDVASSVAKQLGVEPSLVTGITAVAFMTLRQVGLEALKAAPGTVLIDSQHARKTPHQILRERAKDDSQGMLGFLKTADKTWTITFDENREDHRFKILNLQEIASGAATDKRPWHAIDERCTINEGPIPVQCRSASCGTCWVGILGGAEKLTRVSARERKKMKEFGYIDTDDPKPLIRLSCQAQGTGAISIVIPPWNGVFGKHLEKVSSSEFQVSDL